MGWLREQFTEVGGVATALLATAVAGIIVFVYRLVAPRVRRLHRTWRDKRWERRVPPAEELTDEF